MTGLASSATAGQTISPPESFDTTEPIPMLGGATQETRAPNRSGATAAWLSCAVLGAAAVVWFVFAGPGELGGRAEWFFGAAVFVVVLVAIWQTHNLHRRADAEAAAAAQLLRRELDAAAERSTRELALTQKWYRAEAQAREESHRAELAVQQESARVERLHLVRQLQRHAMIEVSRAVGAHTRMLATLWSEGARVLGNQNRDEREAAMTAVLAQIGDVVNDVAVELDNAHLLCEDARLQDALDRINDAVLMAIQVAEDIHDAVAEGRAPQSKPVSDVQRLLYARAAEARRTAWALIRTGLADCSPEVAGPRPHPQVDGPDPVGDDGDRTACVLHDAPDDQRR